MTSRTVLVTGAASGIGAASRSELSRLGWDVVGLDLAGGDGVIQADVSDDTAMARAASQLGDRELNGLVCAAGIWDVADDRYATVTAEVWHRTWAVNVTGTMLTMRHFAPRLRSGGAAVTFASMAALVGMPRRDAYTASKGAIVALSRAWAADLIRQGVRVNCLAPGVVATPMTAARIGDGASDLPLGRAATPTEIAGVVAAVLDATYLNGTLIPVDGGVTAASSFFSLAPRGSINEEGAA